MNVKTYKGKVADLGCLVCGAPAELHHPRFACGLSQRANDWLVVPLCAEHHRLGGYSEAIHNGQQAFEKKYGRECDLLAETIRRMMK